MQTYISKRKTQDQATASTPESAPSRSEMLHLSGAGAPQPMSPALREKFFCVRLDFSAYSEKFSQRAERKTRGGRLRASECGYKQSRKIHP